MAVFYQHDETTITLSGQTYMLKEQIKALGAQFSWTEKTWSLPFAKDNLEAVESLCRRTGGGAINAPAVVAAAAVVSTAVVTEQVLPATLKPRIKRERPTEEGEVAEISYSISQLMGMIAQTLQRDFATPMWIVGEVQNLQVRSLGIFLTLAEGDSRGSSTATITVSANIWPSTFKSLEKKLGGKISEALADGLQVRCLASVNLYRGRGQISLSILDIDVNYLQGALALAREKLLKELRLKGLDAANKRLPMPQFPMRVGLLSALGSRAESDFLHQLSQGAFCGTVIYLPVAMQGERVPDEVTNGILQLSAANCDVIVITRGGGSAADLRWFDNEKIAYAIAGAKVPIIAAIGHHDDFCVAEEICFLKKKTPTAAADFLNDAFLEVNLRLDRLNQSMEKSLSKVLLQETAYISSAPERLSASVTQALKRRSERLDAAFALFEQRVVSWLNLLERRLVRLSSMLPEQAMMKILRNKEPELRKQAEVLSRQIENTLSRHLLKLYELKEVLAKRDVKPWLQTGWTRLSGENGVVLSVAELQVGDAVSARLQDGRVKLRVEGIF